MSLYGYVKKHQPANWTKAFPGEVRRSAVQPKPPRYARQKRIHSRSKAYQASIARYNRLAVRLCMAAHDQGERCPVVHNVPELKAQLAPGSTLDFITQVHHIYGRGHGGRGPLLLDERLYLLCSVAGHAWIDANREAARARGWLAPAGKYNTPVPAHAQVVRNQWGGVEVTYEKAQPTQPDQV